MTTPSSTASHTYGKARPRSPSTSARCPPSSTASSPCTRASASGRCCCSRRSSQGRVARGQASSGQARSETPAMAEKTGAGSKTDEVSPRARYWTTACPRCPLKPQCTTSGFCPHAQVPRELLQIPSLTISGIDHDLKCPVALLSAKICSVTRCSAQYFG